MGLSILIPVFNTSVTSLVTELNNQVQANQLLCEILLQEDGSTSFIEENKLLSTLPCVSCIQREINLGRMVTRQQLALAAQYDYLLFLDADSQILDNNFLGNYFLEIMKGSQVAIGGRVYASSAPNDKGFILHWKYGAKRESGGNAFISNNFLIKKQLFLQLDHSLALIGYGHEDSYWGMQLESLGICFKKIDNPVLHSQLEKNAIFLDKAVQALNNILLLEQKCDKKKLNKQVKIYRWYLRLKKTRLIPVFQFFIQPLIPFFKKNLLSSNPKLFYFDCYRLSELISLSRKR